MEKTGLSNATQARRKLRITMMSMFNRPYDNRQPPAASYSWREMAWLYAAWVALLLFITSRAWVAEDAYITFRVIDNFFNGYGLRWNIDERVQAYTHPLWLLLHMPLFAVFPNLFIDTIFLSVACSMLAIALALACVKKPLAVAFSCLFLPLVLSKSFIDYTSSGLENPLSYLLFAMFGYLLVKYYDHPRFWFYCSLIVALALLNRLDTMMLYIPALGWLCYARKAEIRWGHIVLGALPLAGWFVFSLFYYGFLFPNTKYAKLNTGLSELLYIREGLKYARFLLVQDTAGTLALLAPLAVFIWPKRFSLPAHTGGAGLARSIAAGIYAYVAYVILVGGDYMAGRFWALPIFASVWLFFVCFPKIMRMDIIFVIVCALCGTALTPGLLDDIRKSCSSCVSLKGKVMDARFTFSRNKLVNRFSPLRIRMQGQYNFAEAGKKLAKGNAPVEKQYFIGMIGYYAGPKVHLVDELALADPLLARLPVPSSQVDHIWIGHFRRNLPRGYLDAIKTGKLAPLPPLLAPYYQKLHLITSGDLWSMERLKTIALFNLGYYDHWKNGYLANNPQ